MVKWLSNLFARGLTVSREAPLLTETPMSDLALYRELVAAKRARFNPRGITNIPPLHAALKPLQAHAVDFALRNGCAGIFYDTGLGKTLVELEWGRIIAHETGKPVLLLTPLAVAQQHEAEARKFGFFAKAVREPSEITAPIVITNYERLDHFDVSMFGGIICDESSILKNFSGAVSRELRRKFSATPFRLCASATPAPNDHTEIGQQAEFLGVMKREEMLTRWFIHDSADTGTWRLKGHATADFWSWVASWSRCAEKPSDLNYSDEGYKLPELRIIDHTVTADVSVEPGTDRDGQVSLFRVPQNSATSIHREKRLTIDARMDLTASIVASEPDEPWVIWVETDKEEDAITSRLKGSVAIRGSHKPHVKEERIVSFGKGEIKILVSKSRICGYGLNWQHCARTAFPSASFSYEQWYQAIRRFWRYGQQRPVHAHCIGADTERSIRAVQQRKEADHAQMKAEMKDAMRRAINAGLSIEEYHPRETAPLPAWLAA